jgi:hypothetical protein
MSGSRDCHLRCQPLQVVGFDSLASAGMGCDPVRDVIFGAQVQDSCSANRENRRATECDTFEDHCLSSTLSMPFPATILSLRQQKEARRITLGRAGQR